MGTLGLKKVVASLTLLGILLVSCGITLFDSLLDLGSRLDYMMLFGFLDFRLALVFINLLLEVDLAVCITQFALAASTENNFLRELTVAFLGWILRVMVHLALQVLEDVAAVEAGRWTRNTGGLVRAATVVVLPALL